MSIKGEVDAMKRWREFQTGTPAARRFIKENPLTLEDLGLRVVHTWRDRLKQLLQWFRIMKKPKPNAIPVMTAEPTTPLRGNFVTQVSTTPAGGVRRDEFSGPRSPGEDRQPQVVSQTTFFD